MFCCLLNASGIHPFHIHEVDQGAQYRFNGGAPYFTDLFGIGSLHFNMHTVIIRFINAVVKHFEITFAYATAAQWTMFAFAVIGTVYFFLVSFLVFDGFTKRQYGFVAPRAFVPVKFGVVIKAFAGRFVQSEVGDVSFHIMLLAVPERFATAVSGIGGYLFKPYFVFVQVFNGLIKQGWQALAVSFIGMIGQSTGNYMMGIIN
jgi:hypothetical protein